MKKVSIIVPCYNVEKFIDKCAASLMNQTIGIENVEIIFINDASKDGTLEKLKKIEKKYPDNIFVIDCEENGKQGTARNIGMLYASGKYIGFVDADDYVSKEMYLEMFELAEQKQCDVVRCMLIREQMDGTIAMEPANREETQEETLILTQKERKKIMVSSLHGGIVCGLYKRSFIEENELFFPEKITYEDNYWMAFLLLNVKKMCYMDKRYYHYVVNYESTIMRNDSIHHLDRLVIELMKIEEYQRRGIFNLYHDEIEFNFLRLYFLNTIRILFVRFANIPYDIIYTMQKNVREIFPNYLQNIYLNRLPQLQLELLKIIEIDLNDHMIDLLADGYRRTLNVSIEEV